MRRGILSLLAVVGVILGIYLYPIGGVIWTTGQVTGVGMVSGESRKELQEQFRRGVVFEDAVTTARMDRLRRFLPGVRCNPVDLELQTPGGWVGLRLYCSSGFLFDYIPREAWQ